MDRPGLGICNIRGLMGIGEAIMTHRLLWESLCVILLYIDLQLTDGRLHVYCARAARLFFTSAAL
ncbi:UNVERIFIED_CONTAM: hypothetical protein ABIC26_002208 [Paenibacillus sp. PvR008]